MVYTKRPAKSYGGRKCGHKKNICEDHCARPWRTRRSSNVALESEYGLSVLRNFWTAYRFHLKFVYRQCHKLSGIGTGLLAIIHLERRQKEVNLWNTTLTEHLIVSNYCPGLLAPTEVITKVRTHSAAILTRSPEISRWHLRMTPVIESSESMTWARVCLG
jgi:hypothetical protein